MSTELRGIKTELHTKELGVTQYYGGFPFGRCIQLTQSRTGGDYGYIQLSRKDARKLTARLTKWIKTDPQKSVS